jgi:histidine triad (HIT) family protein
MKKSFSTIFSKIIDKSVPADIVYESKYSLVFKDINPVAPIHLLIIPKIQIKSISSIKDEDSLYLSDLFISAKKVAELLNVNNNGYRLVINNGRDGCQTVDHLHIHFIAGKQLGWPPGIDNNPKH